MADDKRHDPARGRVKTDDRGNSVLDSTIKTANFELVSTQRLKKLLDDEQAGHREAVTQLADSDRDGFLAQDNAGHFQIIGDDDLQALLDQSHDAPAVKQPADVAVEPAAGDDDDLALVSTQRLRKLLDIPEDRNKKASAEPLKDDIGGFDPYNTG